MLKYALEACSISHRVLEVCVKKYAASRDKESRPLSMIILVYLHTLNAHFCPLCSGVGGSRLPKLSALLKGSVCYLEVSVRSMQHLTSCVRSMCEEVCSISR